LEAETEESEESGEVSASGCLQAYLTSDEGPSLGQIVSPSPSTFAHSPGAITKEAFMSLEPGRWLNDDALHSVLQLSAPEEAVGVLLFGSWIWSKLWEHQKERTALEHYLVVPHRGIRRLGIPLNCGQLHWIAVGVWLPALASDNAQALLYDPAGGSFVNESCVKDVTCRLCFWIVQQLGLASDVVVHTAVIPAQSDNFNCGIYAACWLLALAEQVNSKEG